MGIFKDLKNMQNLAAAGKQMQAERFGTTNPYKQMSQALDEANQVVADQSRMQGLLANGLVGTGTIKELRDTGMQVNMQPQLDVVMTVQLEGREPYEATVRQVINHAVLPQFQPGATMPVHVDPADPTSVMIG